MSETKDKNGVVYSDAGRIKSQLLIWKKNDDCGKMAELRRGRAYGLIFPLIKNEYNRRKAEEVGLIVAQLFSISRQHNESSKSFGESIKELSKRIGRAGATGIELRFNNILSMQQLDDVLVRYLLSMAKRCNVNSVGINFYRLYVDLYFWSESEDTKRKWASDFYNRKG
jgi:CRISPR type I-E-associated protein CasB/Cse2